MATTLTLKQDVWIGGVKQLAGASVTVDESLAAQLISENKANRPPGFQTFPNLDKGILFSSYSPLGDGSSEDSAKLIQACADAYSAGLPLLLPKGRFKLESSILNLVSIVGIPNNSTIVIDTIFDKTGSFNNQFAIQNAHFSTAGYNSSTADFVVIKDVNFEVTPQNDISIIGLANVKGGIVTGCNIIINSVINGGTGRPFVTDAIIDCYASVKNFKISNNYLANITYGHGAANFYAAGGGGEIWVRNLVGSAALGLGLANATEDIEICNNILRHQTSDEAIAVYGVVGTTRRIKVHSNQIYGLAVNTSQVCYHNTLVSAFPLKHATLGANASVIDVDFYDNQINDLSAMYSVLRFGNSSDTSVICTGVRSNNNKITAFLNGDATYGAHAQWVAAGSIGSDPAVNFIPMRVIKPSGSLVYSYGGFTSNNDTLICQGSNGANAILGISGFENVGNLSLQGNAYNGVAYCNNVAGGSIEATAYCYYNCNNVNGGEAKFNLTGSNDAVFLVDSTSGRYRCNGVYSSSAPGCFAVISAATTANTFVDINANSATLNHASGYAVKNQSAAAIVTSRLNCFVGTMLAGTNGTVTSSLNRYAGVTD